MSIRVLHVLEDFTRQNTGVTSVVKEMTAWQAKHCEWVGVFVSGSTDEILPHRVSVFESKIECWSGSWRYPQGGKKTLLDILRYKRVDVIHIHGLWRASTYLAAKAASDFNIPAVLSVHGQTSPWALYDQGLIKNIKKKLYWALVRSVISKVSCLHAITSLEKKTMSNLFEAKSFAVIPNAVRLEEFKKDHSLPEKYLLFLGRLHPVKGIENLIRAFSSSALSSEWRLVIAGPEEDINYVKKIKCLAETSRRKIEFIGPTYGQKKTHLLQRAWALVVPSYTEVIGMVNLEAGALNTPSLTTVETGLTDWESGGGVIVSNDENILRTELERTAAWTMADRLERGKLSRSLIESRYSLGVVGLQWMQLYQKLKQQNDLHLEFFDE